MTKPSLSGMSTRNLPYRKQEIFTGKFNPFPAIHGSYCQLSHLLMYFGSLYCKKYGDRSDPLKGNDDNTPVFVIYYFQTNSLVMTNCS